MSGAGQGRPRFRFLERELAVAVIAAGLHGLLAWAALSLSAWCLGTALFLVLSPPWWAPSALALVLLSLAPAAAFAAALGAPLFPALRRVDEATTMEAFLSAPPGPAASLLGEKARRLDEAIAFKEGKGPFSLPALFRGTGRVWGAAGLSLVLLQLCALLALGKPALSWSPRAEATGSGIASSEAVLGTGQETLPPAEGQKPAPAEAAGGQALASQGKAEAATDLALIHEGRLAQAEADSRKADGSEDGGPAPDTPQAAQSSKADRGQEGSEPASTGQPTAEAPKAGKKGRPAAQGYESSDGGLPPSPLIDYKARLFQALTERGGGDVTAGEVLDLAALREYERRFFASYRLDGAIQPREDPWSSLLRQRWLERSGALK
jgi:hypothetical protein